MEFIAETKDTITAILQAWRVDNRSAFQMSIWAHCICEPVNLLVKPSIEISDVSEQITQFVPDENEIYPQDFALHPVCNVRMRTVTKYVILGQKEFQIKTFFIAERGKLTLEAIHIKPIEHFCEPKKSYLINPKPNAKVSASEAATHGQPVFQIQI